ncbi:MAG: DNA/RNA helicase domain-containing protein [Verrucomicrobiota bacterium]
MIVYLETKTKFQEDIISNRIEEKVHDALKGATGKSVGKSELASWKNSLKEMSIVLGDEGIPSDTGVAIEFNIPNTGKRIDFILTGTREDGQRTAVIVELKQWQTAKATKRDAIVSTFVGGREREVSHPSYQAWSYAVLINDYNETVRLDPIHLNPCAYLHNCETPEVILDPFYSRHTTAAPAFLRDDALKLREFIKKHVKFGDKGETMYRIRDGKIRPSKGLADHLASLMQGNKEFTMIDDQKVVYETALDLSVMSSAQNKNVIIVNGGPGTGKTVVAINLLVELTNLGLVAQYVTKNSAPRAVYESKLTGTMRRNRISNLFVGSGGFSNTPKDTFNALIVDEAHRLNEKSGLYGNLGENQIKELIEASNCTIFFLDEDQRIHWKDIGEATQLREWAKHVGATITELELESQFRCNGSNGYLAWIDDVLQIRETANTNLEGANYEFNVCDSASELRDLIYKRNDVANRARMVAGYCWDWKSKKTPAAFDIELPAENFRARWNLTKDGPLWMISKESVSEIGCIHTCQGLELDYIGVIIGPDLIVREGEIITDGAKRSKNDASIKGYKGMLKTEAEAARAKADLIIKNTYRTLMTRGMKGCYIYCTDPETNRYFAKHGVGALTPVFEEPEISNTPPAYPFRILSPEEAVTCPNAVPVFDIKIAAGDFSKEQWLQDCQYAELPDHFTAKPGFFIAQVIGESMNKRIPNGSWCLFREVSDGSRKGKVVIVQSRDIQDPDTGGQYTVKIYRSEIAETEGSWSHLGIRLEPDSMDKNFKSLTLDPDAANDLHVVGEFVGIIS